MQKWDYLVAIGFREKIPTFVVKDKDPFAYLDDMLTVLGKEGWELVSTSIYLASKTKSENKFIEYFYFKRPHQS